MEYEYKELIGKCKTCLFGCVRIEDINFNGVYRCEYYIGGIEDGTNSRRDTKNNETIL